MRRTGQGAGIDAHAQLDGADAARHVARRGRLSLPLIADVARLVDLRHGLLEGERQAHQRLGVILDVQVRDVGGHHVHTRHRLDLQRAARLAEGGGGHKVNEIEVNVNVH